MFAVITNDFIALENAPFGWRWTSEKHSAVPLGDRSEIKPLSEPKALEAWEYAKSLQGTSYRMRFKEIAELEVENPAESLPEGFIREWLSGHLSETQGPVYLSWSERMAVQTDSKTLVKYWNTFCYPVEDVVIWP